MIRLGIIGTGRIARRFISEAEAVEDISITMVYNPNRGSARRFVEAYSLLAYTHRAEELFGQVDAVYIASPNETHYKYIKQMLGHHIHVLCEKPMVLQGEQARELFSLAEEKGCILMEAIKTAYCSGFQAMMETAESGVIGMLKDVEACFTRLTPTNVRELTDEVYGGSFTELGTYTLLPILRLLGTEHEEVHFRSQWAGNGLDAYTKAEFVYENACGMAKTGLLVKSEGQLLIAGTKGYILARSPWWLTSEYEVRFEDSSKREIHTYEYEGTGLRYELDAFVRAIKGENSLKVRPDESICMAEIMESFLEYRTGRHTKKRTKTEEETEETEKTEKTEKTVESEYRQPMKIWAHRGMSFTYPENTLEAFEAAARLPGLTGIELDVQLTSDGEPVVIHDENVEQTTDGVGPVTAYTLQQIKKLAIKAGKNGDTTIPALSEVFAMLKPYCLTKGLLIDIELKNSVTRYAGMEEKVLNMVKEYELEPYVWYSSFLPESMEKIKMLEPEARTGILAYLLEDCITYAVAVGADAMHPYTGGLNVILPKQMRGMPVRAWNCEELFFGEEGEFREMDLELYAGFGVTDVFTNVPERYLKETVLDRWFENEKTKFDV